ncbi:hypothetical protein GALMADRAFT_74592 [Galerina marginata CBS 339.88]|uniref:rRNA methyltransferase 2, mitochondrial n=1 Tax=Galerina marginata (strain CBS 339.88) TaxID=685588 RepID=A0A067SLJ6_GALM3|nr:hypothetical protein GALMADRAFT_74592 [Galerina marginata CBS 339.88]
MVFRQTAIRLSQKSKSKSSSWAARQNRDPYVKMRLTDPAAYRARSAFKLMEINEQANGFLDYPDVNAVVDLGAAPGGWSQVKVAEELDHFDPLNIDDMGGTAKTKGRGTILAVDLLKVDPIPGVKTIQADFMLDSTTTLLKNLLRNADNPEGKADVILSDMASNASGNDVHDIQSSLEICEAVFDFARSHLRSADSIGRRRGGVLLMKFFAHPLLEEFRDDMLKPNFNNVYYVKPDSSRSTSREGYYLCQGWKPF